MTRLALGTIEVTGLPAAIAAADTAVKAAEVTLLGTELTDGAGMVSVKVLGEVSAVKAAMDAARAAASQITAVVGVSVIPRPDEQVDFMALSDDTIGYKADPAANATGDAASTLRMALYAGPPTASPDPPPPSEPREESPAPPTPEPAPTDEPAAAPAPTTAPSTSARRRGPRTGK